MIIYRIHRIVATVHIKVLSIHAKHFRFYSIIVVRTKESAQFRIIITAGGDIEFGIVIVAVSTIAEWIELSDIFSAGIGQTGLFSPYLKRALPLLEI